MREKFMYHKSWILLLGAVLILLIGTPYLTSYYGKFFIEQKQALSQKRDRLAHQLKQWESDNKTAINIRRTISKEEVKNLLTPSNREALTAQIESLAASSRLSNLRFILAPGKPWDGGDSFPGIKKITGSKLLIEADAPHDGDIYNYIEKLATLDGKMALQKLAITPIHPEGTIKTSAYNLHFKATYLWLSNEAEQ